MTARRISLAVGAVVLAFLIVLTVAFTRGDANNTSSPLDGRPAPELVGQTIDGNRFDLARLRGSWVVVNFFATWCVPCQIEHPELVKFSERHRADGDRLVVSVVFSDPIPIVRQFFDRRGGDWPVVTDPDGMAAIAYAVTQVPESVLVDPAGVVVGKIKGGVRADDLDRLIDDLEAGSRGQSPER